MSWDVYDKPGQSTLTVAAQLHFVRREGGARHKNENRFLKCDLKRRVQEKIVKVLYYQKLYKAA